jgi:manganese/iron transport system permease protein/iron/zinc/copper transport system permease protein
VYIVLRQMSYIGHGLSHAVFGGAVVSHLLGVNIYLGAGLWGFGAAVLIQRLTTRRDLHADAVIGIVTTASFAVGVALMSRVHRFTQDFEAVLFGNVLGVSEHDLLLIAVVTGLTGLVVIAFYKQLLFSAFDEEVAQVAGVPTRLVSLLFACILALAILASMQVLGVTLIAATIVIPAATARRCHGNRRCAPPSTGATSCSPAASRSCCGGFRSSPAGRWTWPRKSARITSCRPSRCST